uniref:Uncharacterized protein n=1 Tax=viral metagenome TaxID=1070528 RepID=A0A6C0LRX2_9ZZZZ
MFSSISEAWDHDPVMEITNKLKNDTFSDRNDMYKFKKQKYNLNSLQCRGQSKDNQITSLSLSDGIFHSSLDKSEDIDLDSLTGFNAPINFSDHRLKKSDNFSDFDTVGNSKCSFSVKHLKKCPRCYHKLKEMINKKVDSKTKDLILDYKMKQVQNNKSQFSNMTNTQSELSESFKETLIILIGAFIALLLIFLITKSLFSRN